MSDEQASSSRVKLVGFGAGLSRLEVAAGGRHREQGGRIDRHREQEAGAGKQHNDQEEEEEEERDQDQDQDSCLICLGEICDRCVLPKCLHSLFCFGCILKWISIHRRCPLCSISVDEYIIHSIVSDDDYVRHYLPRYMDGSLSVVPPSTSARGGGRNRQTPAASGYNNDNSDNTSNNNTNSSSSSRVGVGGQVEWGRDRTQERQKDAIANWDRRLAFRKTVYRQGLYALHVGSNTKSKLHSPASSSTIASSKPLESTILSFLRRELLAYPFLVVGVLDVDFLSHYMINVLKTFDVRSNEAIDLIADYLDDVDGAQHLCHEIYTFCRFIGEGGGGGGAGAGQRDKVKAFDEWVRYSDSQSKQSKKGGIRERRRRRVEEEEEADRRKQAQTSGGILESVSMREEVKRSREGLLQRLEQESAILSGGAGGANADADSAREKSLRDRVMLHRREALLKKKAMEHRGKRMAA